MHFCVFNFVKLFFNTILTVTLVTNIGVSYNRNAINIEIVV